MVLYLSSNKFGSKTSFLKDWIKKHNNKILLIFNALDAKDIKKVKENIAEDKKLLEEIGFDVKVVDLKEYFDNYERLKKDFKSYKNYCVMGGNVFVLRQAMKYSGFDKYLKETATKDYLYIGYNAGSCILSSNLKIYDIVDEPINIYQDDKIIYDGLGLIDYNLVPHYKSNYHKAYLIDELVHKCQNENIKYKAIKDTEVIIENFK